MRYNWEGPAQIAAGVVPAIQAGFQAGQRTAALTRYQTDPQAGINALMPVDPALAMHMQGSVDQRARLAAEEQRRLATVQQEKHERDTKVIATMAQNARDPQSWDAAVDQIVSMGYPDAAQFKGKFTPAVRAAIMAAGGIEDEQAKPQAPPNIQREYEYYVSVGRKDLADQLLARHAEGPPIVANNGDGTFTIVPPSVARGATPGRSSPPAAGGQNEATLRQQAADAIARGADPAKVNARLEQMLKGGAGQAGPQTFP